MLGCIANVSEGRDADVLAALAAAAGEDLLDLHRDPHHHRSVLTMVGEEAPRRVAEVVVARLDLRGHDGAHPRIGALDVVPFVPWAGAALADAVRARDDFCTWAAAALGLPCFRYGPERSLPEVRRGAFAAFEPDCGGPDAHPTAGACAVGARPALVAYNVWVDADLATARAVAGAVRGPAVRALGLQVGDRVQVSMNLVDPVALGPGAAYDLVAARAPVTGAELVGLVPDTVLRAEDPARWDELDLAESRTVEARLGARG